MLLHYRLGDEYLYYCGKKIRASCDVRNELNGRRKPHEVVYTMPGKKPYFPREFPPGFWKVGRPVRRTSKELAPFFIPTDAHQLVQVWEIKDGKYFLPTQTLDDDKAYGLHFSGFSTTLGCIKIEDKNDLLELVNEINIALDLGHDVLIRVYGRVE